MTPRRVALASAGAVVAVDQLTKWWALAALADGPIRLIDGFLQFRLVRNPGAAFGLIPGAGSLVALAALAAVVVIVMVVRQLGGPWEGVAMGLVLGGAVGNLIDRVLRAPGLLDGEVVDFVDFDFFPTFNTADSAITIGAILAVLLTLRRE